MDEDQAPQRDSPPPPEVKNVLRRSEPKRFSEIFREFDNLDLSLICSEGEDPLSDLQSVSDFVPGEAAELPEQPDASGGARVLCEADGNPSAQEADLALCRCEDGVETALQYAKMWCRYAKDLLAWMEKRISLEQEFAKNIIKTSEGARGGLAQQESMPLLYVFAMAMEQDIRNSQSSRRTFDLIHHRCYQALSAKKNEIDKWRREFKEQWAKEQRRMNEAVAALKKARQQYYQRCDELERAKAVTAKMVEETAGSKTLDRRRKSKDEARSRVLEAELLYKQCVCDARIHQDELVKVKERIVSHTRKLICQGDTVLREATVNMFHYQRQQTESLPLEFHNLELSSRGLEPGEPFLIYVLSRRRPEQPPPSFAFQEYVAQGKRHKRKSSNPEQSPSRPGSGRIGCSDSESIGGSLESLTSSAVTKTSLLNHDDLDDHDFASESECIDGLQVKVRTPSRAALMHRLRKMKSKMVRCKQCDNYIVVNGVECEECGLGLHRKCMEVCQLECEHHRGGVFGTDLPLLLRDKPEQEVPFVVRLCTAEIESRALSVQGVYRVSGSKPRIQKLCQAFELQREQVDLHDLSPHDITSILKHFFKELPEPLLTFDLYNDFMVVGKNIQHVSEREPRTDGDELMEVVEVIQKLLQKLPTHCYTTLRHMMLHLHRVSENVENKMSPSNLGIVFGPTLLRPLVATDMSMLALLETSYQAVLVEFLISHHHKIFGAAERSDSPDPPERPEPPVPTAAPPDTPPRGPGPLPPEPRDGEASLRERPHSLESRSVKRESSEGYISDKSSSNEAVDQISPAANQRTVLAVTVPPSDPWGLLGAEPDPDAAPQPHPWGLLGAEPDPDAAPQPHHRFVRQPVKYQRHHGAVPRLSNPGAASGQPAGAARAGETPGSAGSSRSSSPSGRRGPARPEAPLSPRQLVQYMLGLETAPPPCSAAPPQVELEEPGGGATADPAHRAPHSPKTLPVEPHPSGPAQKVLSGLKLRRSHSGKDEQLFV